jgi:hypothetical protein
MRQGQQNRRGRGRSNNSNNNSNNHNNRKSQNPLTRSFESTGPDVKVRGTPAHVAEKYISLARDALSSGDRVLAENYLQHAEHYNRIILTYREQQMSQGGEFQGHLPRAQTFNAQDPMDSDEFGDDDGDEMSGNVQPHAGQGEGQPQSGGQGPSGGGQGGQPQHRSFDGPQRYDNRPPRHDNRGEPRQHNQPRHDRDGNRFDRGDRQDRGEHRNFNRQDRGDRQGRQDARPERFDRGDRPDPLDREPREFRDDRPPQAFVEPPMGSDIPAHGNGRPPRRERFSPNMTGERQPPAFAGQPPLPPIAVAAAPQPVVVPVPAAAPPMEASEQPAFLRRPVRRPRRDDSDAAPAPRPPVVDETE